ncbi:MAG: hypothetical protein HUK20_08235 [Fibrobacter sp.]|nr:hypothetical protein [Fibrobacter sp.]
MPLISRILILFVLLVVSVEAMDVQVMEGEADDASGLFAKKLQAMAMVYLAELGHVPSSDIKKVGVSFSASGPGMRFVRMKKFSFNGQIEEDSVVVADLDGAGDAVESMLTIFFGPASKLYRTERPSKVFFKDPELIDADDNTAKAVVKSVEQSLEELGYELAESDHETQLRMFLVRLKKAYWLGMIRIEGSKVIKGAHKTFMPDDELETVIYSLTNNVMDLSVVPKASYTRVVDYSDTHEEKCRATDGTSSVSGALAGFTFDMFCNLSNYLGLEVAAGGKDLYNDWYPEVRLDYIMGFSDKHAFLFGLDYAGTAGHSKSRWALELIHRFSQKKGLFFDFVWGWGYDKAHDGWYMGGDLGYNLFALGEKSHWLSLMARYDWAFGEYFTEEGRISINLVYDIRGYFTD